jgi:hypothetical protein
MAKQLINEAERYLLEHWADAVLLEDSMEGVRKKYKEIFERVVEAVTEKHPEFDLSIAFVTQRWTSGEAGFGKSSWPNRKYPSAVWPSGLYMSGIRLENLATDDSESVSAYVWLADTSGFDGDSARKAAWVEAQKRMPPEALKSARTTEYTDCLLEFDAPSKSELLEKLLKDDGQEFVDCLVAQFDLMARFVPVLDEIFQKFSAAEPEK